MKKKVEFKKGDRVAVYGYVNDGGGHLRIIKQGARGTLRSSTTLSPVVEVEFDASGEVGNVLNHPKTAWAFPGQLRLVKKKPIGRRVFVRDYDVERLQSGSEPVHVCAISLKAVAHDDREYVEVRK